MQAPLYYRISFRDHLARSYNPLHGSRILHRRYGFFADWRDAHEKAA